MDESCKSCCPKYLIFHLHTKKIKPIQIGDFVEVPFGKNKEIGVVWHGKALN